MKTLIALAIALNTATAFAFINDGGDAQSMASHNGKGEVVGNGNAEGEATFTMSFTGKGKTAGDFKGNGVSDINGNFSGAQYRPYGYGSPYYYNFPASEAK